MGYLDIGNFEGKRLSSKNLRGLRKNVAKAENASKACSLNQSTWVMFMPICLAFKPSRSKLKILEIDSH